MGTASGILLLSCPDRSGLVAGLTGFLADRGANLLHMDQFVDPVNKYFFFRAEWDLETYEYQPADFQELFTSLFPDKNFKYSLHRSDRLPRVAVLGTRENHCVYDLLTRFTEGEMKGRVAFLGSNHPHLEPIAGHFNLPFYHFPVSEIGKPAAEARIMEKLAEHGVELVVLAKYMQILSEDFVNRYPEQIINIHHSFLPAFVGARPYHQAHERGVKLIGATSHYVTTNLDAGPIIEQDTIQISHRHQVSDMVRTGRDIEKIVLSRAVRLHLERRILVRNNKTVVFS